ncbi:MAG TPA: nitrilase-related carbon-nitrogen hydrolase [Methylomirabilota bacterium]|nr:nitrilase-related carbon-nitrogen hydrolase [Methylomirabilota bacterium]
MNIQKPSANTCDWKKSFLWLALAVACFHAAYASIQFPALGLFIFGYAYFLIRLTDQPNVRRAFYFGLATGFLCAAPQLFFFWKIFSVAAIMLWIVFAFWIGLFAAIVCGSIRRWGKAKAMWLIPIVWTGIEYFRSELYYLKFSWLNVGYALPNFQLASLDVFGMYSVGFLVFLITATFSFRPILKKFQILSIILIFVIPIALFFTLNAALRYKRISQLSLVGIQMEFPSVGILPKVLNQALAKNTNAQIFVLSEYTLDSGVPDSLKNWCRDNSKFLVVGGKDVVTNHIYYNTVFVVGTNGEIIFKQAKSVPIQFFDDGLPAPKQGVWNSPWGKIGICICYDLSYTRITDELVKQGAQLLIVPTMDVSEWGKHEHELHSRVAPVRAAEYGIPIFRLASSGISQAVTGGGYVVAQTSFDKSGEILSAQLRLPTHGSLPLDRFLAPICTGITAIVTAVLIFLNWKDNRAKSKSS